LNQEYAIYKSKNNVQIQLNVNAISASRMVSKMLRKDLVINSIRKLINKYFAEDEVLYNEEVDSDSIIITINLPITDDIKGNDYGSI